MQHPLLLPDALDAARRAAGRGAHGLLDLVDERAHEAAVGGVEHDEQLGDGEDVADVEHDDVAALLLVGGAGGERARRRGRRRRVRGQSPVVSVAGRRRRRRGRGWHGSVVGRRRAGRQEVEVAPVPSVSTASTPAIGLLADA